MRHNTIGGLVALGSALALFACKDTTASGPTSIASGSSVMPSTPVFAKLPAGCKHVKGDVELTLVPSPNDPFGRSLGPSNGVLKGAATSTITSIIPGVSPGELVATSFDVGVFGPNDFLTSTGVTTYTPIPGAPNGEFSVATTQTITGGSGTYAGATGTIAVTGVAHDFSGGPGNAWFDLKYDGTVCT